MGWIHRRVLACEPANGGPRSSVLGDRPRRDSASALRLVTCNAPVKGTDEWNPLPPVRGGHPVRSFFQEHGTTYGNHAYQCAGDTERNA
eukprot:3171803-Prymnesium_polylepis.1